MKIAIAQIDTTIGDFDGNAKAVCDRLKLVEDLGADLVVFPELTVCGYPPRDLLEKPSFVDRNLEYVERIASKTKRVAVVVGYVSMNETQKGKGLFNTAGILHDGAVRFEQHKSLLPEYDVFDEARHFEPANKHAIYDFKGKNIGLTLCEDLWSSHRFGGRKIYELDPLEPLAKAGADFILNLSASPFTLGKQDIRYSLVKDESARFGLPIVYCNLVGGNDELVFDGRSFVVNSSGTIVAEAAAFKEDTLVVDLESMPAAVQTEKRLELDEVEQALTLGLRDYMGKCGFDRCVIGLSGGIDSAVVAAIAAKAVGPERVMGVLMQSQYTKMESVTYAQSLAKNLGISTHEVPIEDIFEEYRKAMEFNEGEVSLAEENLQARIRGNILMAISNRDGALVVSTGNKSEVSVGYCTLYGDMAGGLALISDIPKTMVYDLARHINEERELIPQPIIDRPPSAELKPDQTDQDSLPPYDILDRIIKGYVEDGMTVESIVAQGEDKDIVERVIRMIDMNEYKRRQAAPGIKITSKAFGSGRRFPIARKT